jgi:hypothetical protein
MSALAALLSLSLWAQSPPADSGFTRGTLLERDANASAGEFAIRMPDSEVLRFRFDSHTRVEREEHTIDVPGLAPGEPVEVASDSVDGSLLRYARTVRVLASAPPAPARRVPTFVPLRHYTLPEDPLAPQGDLTYAGVIGEIAGARLVLHTRDAGDQTILLRKDTRYLENGKTVEAGDLKPNQRVFVRAGRDPYGEIEGYQVIWGRILQPRE